MRELSFLVNKNAKNRANSLNLVRILHLKPDWLASCAHLLHLAHPCGTTVEPLKNTVVNIPTAYTDMKFGD